MKIMCARCGAAMALGELKGKGLLLDTDEPLLSFVVSSGTPTSLNPVKAILQGMRGEPDHQERVFAVRARACSACGVVEFCLDPDEAKQLVGMEQPAEQQ